MDQAALPARRGRGAVRAARRAGALQRPARSRSSTADTESHVALVDLDASAPSSQRIARNPAPAASSAPAGRGRRAHRRRAALDPPRGGVEHVLDGVRAEPRYTAARDGRLALVTDSGRRRSSPSTSTRGTVVAPHEAPALAAASRAPPDGKHAGDRARDRLPELAIVDEDPRRALVGSDRRSPLHDVGFAPDGRVWLTSGEQQSIWAGRRCARRRARPST